MCTWVRAIICIIDREFLSTYIFHNTVVREIFAYRNFHVLIFRVKKFSDIVYLSEKLTQNLNNYE